MYKETNYLLDKALLAAVRSGNIKLVKSTLKEGGSPNASEDWSSALDIAARDNYPQIVRLLLRWGAKVESTKKGFWTPLMRASMNGHEEVVRILLKKGADPLRRHDQGFTALSLAAGHERVEVLKVLLGKIPQTREGMLSVQLARYNAERKSKECFAVLGDWLMQRKMEQVWRASKTKEFYRVRYIEERDRHQSKQTWNGMYQKAAGILPECKTRGCILAYLESRSQAQKEVHKNAMKHIAFVDKHDDYRSVLKESKAEQNQLAKGL